MYLKICWVVLTKLSNSYGLGTVFLSVLYFYLFLPSIPSHKVSLCFCNSYNGGRAYSLFKLKKNIFFMTTEVESGPNSKWGSICWLEQVQWRIVSRLFNGAACCHQIRSQNGEISSNWMKKTGYFLLSLFLILLDQQEQWRVEFSHLVMVIQSFDCCI